MREVSEETRIVNIRRVAVVDPNTTGGGIIGVLAAQSLGTVISFLCWLMNLPPMRCVLSTLYPPAAPLPRLSTLPLFPSSSVLFSFHHDVNRLSFLNTITFRYICYSLSVMFSRKNKHTTPANFFIFHICYSKS